MYDKSTAAQKELSYELADDPALASVYQRLINTQETLLITKKKVVKKINKINKFNQLMVLINHQKKENQDGDHQNESLVDENHQDEGLVDEEVQNLV